jgi:hypothetical protein
LGNSAFTAPKPQQHLGEPGMLSVVAYGLMSDIHFFHFPRY